MTSGEHWRLGYSGSVFGLKSQKPSSTMSAVHEAGLRVSISATIGPRRSERRSTHGLRTWKDCPESLSIPELATCCSLKSPFRTGHEKNHFYRLGKKTLQK